MTLYYRPILHTHPFRPKGAKLLAGGWTWFDMVEGITRDGASRPIHISELPDEICQNLTTPRAPIAGLDFSAPRLMGVLNVTPDSFSDGGQHNSPDHALAHARTMAQAGADMIDVGGESTRPGAALIAEDEEITRTAPVIAAITAALNVPVSIDTRKTAVARAAHQAGVALVNDVAGFTFTPDLAPFCAESGLPVCIMHAQGTPEIMQKDPRYDHVALDVYDYLEARIDALTEIGIPRTQIIIDPGIGFGKTQGHNLTLLQNLSLFHGLGCPLLLGASRKRFIGDISGTPTPKDRVAGSVAVALAGVAQGVQMLRVHDVAETSAALKLWRAATLGIVP